MALDRSSNFIAGSDSLTGPMDIQASAFHPGEANQEQTVLGSVIGSARNLLPGSHEKEARGNDQIARIVADTVAALPIFGTAASGVARAAMLYNPNQGFGANAPSFLLNAAEGAALNKVGRMASSESALARALTVRMGQGLATEVALNLSVGFGFGAVRSGFSPDTWKGKEGGFDLLKGGQTVLESGALGAVINVPAGMLGTRIASFGARAAGESAISRTVAGVVSGAGSGYASGAVFGGLDALAQHRSWSDILKTANEGGIIGAITGGGLGASQALRVGRAATAQTAVEQAQQPGAKLVAASALAAEVPQLLSGRRVLAPEELAISQNSDRVSGSRGNTEIERALYDSLNIKPVVMKLGDAGALLEDPVMVPFTREVAAPVPLGQDGVPLKFSSENAYLKTVISDQIQARQYGVKGSQIKILVPEPYALSLDQVRPLRQLLEEPGAAAFKEMPGPLRDQALELYGKIGSDPQARGALEQLLTPQKLTAVEPYLDAYSRLLAHPHGARMLPEDYLQLVFELPNRSRIARLILEDQRSHMDPWFAQKYESPDFKSAATTTTPGDEISFFQQSRPLIDSANPLKTQRQYLYHEDSHLDDPRTAAKMDSLFKASAALEEQGHYSTNHAKRTIFENRAEHYADFLAPEADTFFNLTREAPLRSVALAQRVAKLLDSTPPEFTSPHADVWRARVDYVNEHVVPNARDVVYRHMFSGDATAAGHAVEMLKTIGIAQDAPNLVDIAAHYKGTPLAQDALKVAVDLTANPQEQYNLLTELARPASDLHNEAVDLMTQMGRKLGPLAPYYARLLKAAGNPNKTPELLDLAESMPDARGRVYAFDELMKLTSGNAVSQRSMVSILLGRSPDLTAHALNYLTQQHLPISDLVDAATVRHLSQGHNIDAVRPLMKIAAERPDLAPVAQQALQKYAPNLIRYIKHEFGREQTLQTLQMQQDNKVGNFYDRRTAIAAIGG